MTHSKISFFLRARRDRSGNLYYVGRPSLPILVSLDRFIALCFPYKGNREKGEEDGAEIVLELAHEDPTFRNASKILRKVAEKIKDPHAREVVTGFLTSVMEGSLASQKEENGITNGSSQPQPSSGGDQAKIEELEEEVRMLRRELLARDEHFRSGGGG